jgi:hypothetical protein
MKKLYKYPEPDEIQINESALRLKFRQFGETVKNSVSLLDLFLIVPAWVPVFFSTFNGFRGIPGAALKAGYTTLILLATIGWLGRNRFMVRVYKKFIVRDKSWVEPEIEPDKMVDVIKQECLNNETPLQQLSQLINRDDHSVGIVQQKNSSRKQQDK